MACSASFSVAVLFALSACFNHGVSGQDFEVIEVDWREYVVQKTIQVPTNSIIKFIWNNDDDYTVTEFLTEEDWQDCNFDISTDLSVSSPYYLIPDSEADIYTGEWTPDTFYYFGCATGKHCKRRDMKIKVYTGSLPTTTTTTTTTTSTTSTTTTTTTEERTTTSTTSGTTSTTTTTTTTTAIPDFLLGEGSGTCAAAGGCVIETKKRCAQAAETLGLDDLTVNIVAYPGKVPGCYLNNVGDLTFNTQVFANIAEGTDEQTMICLDCGTRSCPSSCYGTSCDVWTEQYAISCDELEKEYACDCGGCLCWYDMYNYAGSDSNDFTECATPCNRQLMAGDGYCDDDNNHCGCDWDGGDCCSTAVPILDDYCDDCLCLDPDYTDYCEYGCEFPTFAGDSFCDDGNNHCGCDWDGGDCCGQESQYTYCTDCECLDPTLASQNCTAGCFKNAWTGDGYCDDGNNNCGCDWDGGDCCGAGNNYNYCQFCSCLEPGWAQANPSSGRCTGECQKPAWQGDGFCDDGNNVCGCDWDLGDCCDKGSKYTFCLQCKCADLFHVAACDSTCRYEEWLGDGICDDGNNHCGCNWDEGDCCGNNNMNVCSKDWDANHDTDRDACKCLDPSFDVEECGGHCKHEAWTGDGVCDVANNNCGCDWDHGDCCDPASSFEYCAGEEKCDCLDDASFSGCNVGCYYSEYAGDGFCDDENNGCGCDWDGGDCCAGLLTYCTDCECLDPNAGECHSICAVDAWVGDLTCDDGNNNCGCGWDGGDCCGTEKYYDYTQCTDCLCLQPDGCNGTCETRGWTGDGYCDDGNNNCGCGWDGGDCCAGDSNYNYCSDCACKNPLDGTYYYDSG